MSSFAPFALISVLTVAPHAGCSNAGPSAADLQPAGDGAPADGGTNPDGTSAGGDVGGPAITAAWPEADALFHADKRWLGADAAYSVNLGNDRVLWLFGDTFIATSEARVRQESRMVRNTIALQEGLCPTTATIRFFWKGAASGEPASFFGETGEQWLWPLHGVVVDGALTLFFLREEATSDGLGFESVGWRALRVHNPEADPEDWSMQWLEEFETPFPVAVGTSVLQTDQHVLAYAVEEPGAHDVYLLRWTRSAFAAADLSAPEWWDSDGGYRPHASLAVPPRPVFREGQTELSVSHDERLGIYVEIQTVGFGSTTVGRRTAETPEGPWSELREVFTPPESQREDAFVYAAKAHPELTCPGGDRGLVVTYAANAWDFGDLVKDSSIYYPRFVTIVTD